MLTNDTNSSEKKATYLCIHIYYTYAWYVFESMRERGGRRMCMCNVFFIIWILETMDFFPCVCITLIAWNVAKSFYKITASTFMGLPSKTKTKTKLPMEWYLEEGLKNKVLQQLVQTYVTQKTSQGLEFCFVFRGPFSSLGGWSAGVQ